MNKELEAFREGVKWGLTLFSPTDLETKEQYMQTSSGKRILLSELYKEVDEGRWDNVLKNK